MKRVAFLASLFVGIVAIAVYVWADHYTPSGCERPKVFVSTTIKWPASGNDGDGNIEYLISRDYGGSSKLVTDVLAAAQQWNNVTCKNGNPTGFPVLEYDGLTNKDAGKKDNTCVVGFARIDGVNGLPAHVDYWTRSGDPNTLIECDMRFDYEDDFETHDDLQPPTTVDGFCIQDTATHEFGHFGLLNDVRPHNRCGSGHDCSRYQPYTMQNCFEFDQHFRESIHGGDELALWWNYERP